MQCLAEEQSRAERTGRRMSESKRGRWVIRLAGTFPSRKKKKGNNERGRDGSGGEEEGEEEKRRRRREKKRRRSAGRYGWAACEWGG